MPALRRAAVRATLAPEPTLREALDLLGLSERQVGPARWDIYLRTTRLLECASVSEIWAWLHGQAEPTCSCHSEDPTMRCPRSSDDYEGDDEPCHESGRLDGWVYCGACPAWRRPQ